MSGSNPHISGRFVGKLTGAAGDGGHSALSLPCYLNPTGRQPRKSGVSAIGDVPWGTHLCIFYNTKGDLIDILVSYVKAGLENNEFCIWITSEPLSVKEAKEALEKKVKDLSRRIKKGQMEILDYTQWYNKIGKFEGDKVLCAWVEKEKQAIKKGFDGLRLTGNTSWLEQREWRKFAAYEKKVETSIASHRMIALCTYSLDKCSTSEILDVISNHQLALIKKGVEWEVVESTTGKRAQKKIEKLQDGTEAALKWAKEYNENIISSMIDALIVLDPSGAIQTVNQSTCELLGYKEKSLIGQPIGMLLEEDGIFEKCFRKFLRKGPVIDYNTFFRTKKGKKIPVSVHGSVLRNKKRKLIGAVFTVRDMRAKVASETALKESEERYRGVVENITDAIFILDRDNQFLHMNRPGLNLNGLKQVNEIVGKSFIDSVHKKYQHVLRKALKEVWSGENAHCHYESTTFEGVHKWWECNLIPFGGDTGKVINIIGISRDLTLYKYTEKTIEHYREYAANVVANIPSSILVVNRDGIINFANKNFLNRMNLGERDVLGEPLKRVLGPSYSGLGIDDKIRYIISGGNERPFGRFHLSGFVYDYRILPIKERVARRLNAMLIMEDVTEKTEMESQLRQSEKMSALGQLTAGIAHEINNPLSIIKGNVQYLRTLLDEVKTGRKRRLEEEILDVIEKESSRCGEIISNLLYFSRRPKGERTPVDFNRVVRRTARLLERQFSLSNIDLQLSLDNELKKMMGDESLLQQVMMNLLVNAQQAMPNGGKISIDTENVDDESVLVRVTDTGGGIRTKDIKDIFNPYFTTKGPGKGTGLGLSIVHSMVVDHGGEITAENTTGRYKGAMFTLKFHATKG